MNLEQKIEILAKKCLIEERGENLYNAFFNDLIFYEPAVSSALEILNHKSDIKKHMSGCEFNFKMLCKLLEEFIEQNEEGYFKELRIRKFS